MSIGSICSREIDLAETPESVLEAARRMLPGTLVAVREIAPKEDPLAGE